MSILGQLLCMIVHYYEHIIMHDYALLCIIMQYYAYYYTLLCKILNDYACYYDHIRPVRMIILGTSPRKRGVPQRAALCELPSI